MDLNFMSNFKFIRRYSLIAKNLLINSWYLMVPKSTQENLQKISDNLFDMLTSRENLYSFVKCCNATLNFVTCSLVRRCLYFQDVYSFIALANPYVGGLSCLTLFAGIFATIAIQTYAARAEEYSKNEHFLLQNIVHKLYKAKAANVQKSLLPDKLQGALQNYEIYQKRLAEAGIAGSNYTNTHRSGWLVHTAKVIAQGCPEDVIDVLAKLWFVGSITGIHQFALLNSYLAATVKSKNSEGDLLKIDEEIFNFKLCVPPYRSLVELEQWNEELNSLSYKAKKRHKKNEMQEHTVKKPENHNSATVNFIINMGKVAFYNGFIEPVQRPYKKPDQQTETLGYASLFLNEIKRNQLKKDSQDLTQSNGYSQNMRSCTSTPNLASHSF